MLKRSIVLELQLFCIICIQPSIEQWTIFEPLSIIDLSLIERKNIEINSELDLEPINWNQIGMIALLFAGSG